ARGYSSAAKEITVRDALNSALDEEMSADPSVFLMGEEVGEYQGAYKITKGLLDKYGPDRVLDTPITERLVLQALVLVQPIKVFGQL
uniref:Pyruvate dehydrogenase E1 component subunit beta n=1 Tax=Aegilops tauschii subsp. strangulata TaxID=200361 RepID=A0A453L9A2_AEGTS